jgi:hypothetical protein
MKYGALTFDSQTVVSNGFDFDGGLLAQLKQLKHDSVQVVVTDTVKSEVARHLSESIQQALSALDTAVKKAVLHDITEVSFPDNLRGRDKARARAVVRLLTYLSDLNAKVLDHSGVRVEELMRRYFGRLPPFSKKKNEFPDAISLLTLEEWAKSKDLRVLAISGDGDWEAFAAESTHIDVVKTVSEALNLIHGQMNTARVFAGTVLDKIAADNTSDLAKELGNKINDALEGVDVEGIGNSHYHIEEVDRPTLDLRNFKILSDGRFLLLEGDQDLKEVVVLVKAELDVDAATTFYLSIFDSVDKDYSRVGSVEVPILTSIEVEMIIILRGPEGSVVIDRVEITEAPEAIDFGEVEPERGIDPWANDEELQSLLG